MHVWVYKAALLCDSCGKVRRDIMLENGVQDNGDSDTFPQGPYADGGGEADTPNHCDRCDMFLENALTTDGMDYVRERAEVTKPDEMSEAMLTWLDFYAIRLEQVAQ